MAKRRVFDIAKDYGMTSDELLTKLKDAGFELKSRLSTADDEDVKRIINGGSKEQVSAKPEADEEAAEAPKHKKPGFVIKKKAKLVQENKTEEQQPVTIANNEKHVDEPTTYTVVEHIEETAIVATSVEEQKAVAVCTNSPFAKEEDTSIAQSPAEEKPIIEQVTAAPVVENSTNSEPVAVKAEEKTVETKNNSVPLVNPAVEPAAAKPAAQKIVETNTENISAVKEVAPVATTPVAASANAAVAPGAGPRVIRVIDREKLIERMQQNRGAQRNNQRGNNNPNAANSNGNGPRPNNGQQRSGYANNSGNNERWSGQGNGGGYDRRPNNGYNRSSSSSSSIPTMSLDDMAKVAVALGQVTEVNMRERRRATLDYDHQSFDDEGNGRFGGRRQQLTKRDLMDMRERDVSTTRLRKKKVHKGAVVGHTQITEVKESKRVIKISDKITVGDLAQRLGIKAAQVIKQLMGLGSMVTTNDYIDMDTAQIVAEEYNYRVENISTTEEELLDIVTDKPEDLESRPPVVTVMGHVDHGKTSILDAIRRSDVAKHEHGGITQHIGAYSVQTPNGTVAFIDTPGHAAFTAMRARGAQVTDIVVLVVAADDGVMPQTIEAIHHAQAAKVPIIVAVNKCDMAGANPDRVMQALTEYGLLAEEWGGETIFVKTAAVKGEGIPELLENILLQAEMLELTANPHKAASGTVIEAELDKGRGPVATILVQDGTLKIGDYVIAGSAYGKVRALVDARGTRLKEAGPSIPVEIQGLGSVPSPGDSFNAVESLDKAKELAEMRLAKLKEEAEKKAAPASLEDLLAKMGQNGKKELKVLVKTDVQGSMEALKSSLDSQSNEEVEVKVIHAGVGAITESDVILAAASQAIIVGFNVRPDAKAASMAESEHIDIKTYRVIYDVLDDIKAAMTGMLRPIIAEKVLGRAQVIQTFKVPKVGTIAGSKVISGKITRTAQVRLLRDNVVVFEGKICSLRHFKDDVREVQSGHECGIGIENYQDVHLGDVIEAFTMEETAATAN